MFKRSTTAVAALLLLLSAAAPSSPEGAAWWKHVEFLASDKLQGRNAGSPGHQRAAGYVAAQFKKAGLAPCGDAGLGYVQRVPLVSKQLVEAQSSLEAVVSGKSRTLVLGDDAILSTRGDLPPSLDAGAVFLGYGLAVPAEGGGEAGYDDFAGQDVRGKLVVTISGSPASLPGPLRAHFSSAAERSKALAAAGAAGILTITNPKTSDVPWARTSAARLLPSMSLDDPSLADSRGPSYSAALNATKAAWLFEGTGHTLDQLLTLASASKPLPRFALPVNFRTRSTVTKTKLTSQNVCGIWKGADPAESVVLSAHLDHLGADPAASGPDKIYNGAMDNASGIATLIETARHLRATSAKTKRSVVFVAVTAEEKGLLGSRYFAGHPPAAAGAIAANLNFDMFLPIHPMKKVMVMGLEESSLRAPVETVAGRLGLGVQSDLEPHRNRFIRSDQYSFIQRGVPALALKVGYDPGSPEAATQKQWTAERYHAVGDDLAQPVDIEAAVLFNRLVRELALEVATAPARPQWNPSSFFRRFAKPGAPGEATSGAAAGGQR